VGRNLDIVNSTYFSRRPDERKTSRRAILRPIKLGAFTSEQKVPRLIETFLRFAPKSANIPDVAI
jgi:hypothetical protein